MTEKERHKIEAVVLGIFLLLVIPLSSELRPDENYPSITQWWGDGARLKQECRCYDLIRDCFWSDDWIGNLFHNFYHWLAGYTIPLWNSLTASWYGQAVLTLIVAIAATAFYDLIKATLRKLFSDQPEQQRVKSDG